jgi:transcriptional regulator with XRE-family HTH domain
MRDVDTETFGKRLKEMREKRGLTQEELAKAIGLKDKRAVSAWETGKYLPSVNAVYRLSQLFGVSVDYIVGRTDDPLGAAQQAGDNEDIRLVKRAFTKMTDTERRRLLRMIESFMEEEDPEEARQARQIMKSLLPHERRQALTILKATRNMLQGRTGEAEGEEEGRQ